MKPWGNRFIATLICMVSTGIAGCDHEQDVLPTWDADVKVTLKVMHENERSFMKNYGALFQMKYPNITLDVIESGAAATDQYVQLVKENRPDVVMMTAQHTYDKLWEDGALYNMDMLVRADQYDIQSFAPSVIKQLRERASGALPMLTPSFGSRAVYYNKTLFDTYRVAYPRDRMTWEELLRTAQRFPADQGIVGLAMLGQDPYLLFRELLDMMHLSPFSADGRTTSVQSSTWKSLLTTTILTYKSGAVVPKPSSGPMDVRQRQQADSFLNGRYAMTVDWFGYKAQLDTAQSSRMEMPDWDIVTLPVQSRHPVTTYSIYEMYGITSTSVQLRPAWELMKFIHSEEVQRVHYMLRPELLPSRTNIISNPENRHMEAFWVLAPEWLDERNDGNDYKSEFWIQSREAIEAAFAESQSVSDTLKQMQQTGERIIEEIDSHALQDEQRT